MKQAIESTTPFDETKIPNFHKMSENEFAFLREDEPGFYLEGLSAGLAFLIYQDNQLHACYNLSGIPASTAKKLDVEIFLQKELDFIQRKLKIVSTNQNRYSIFVFGGQQSSQNLLDVLTALANDLLIPCKFNINNIKMTGNDETQDICVEKATNDLQFYIHHCECKAEDGKIYRKQYDADFNHFTLVEVEQEPEGSLSRPCAFTPGYTLSRKPSDDSTETDDLNYKSSTKTATDSDVTNSTGATPHRTRTPSF